MRVKLKHVRCTLLRIFIVHRLTVIKTYLPIKIIPGLRLEKERAQKLVSYRNLSHNYGNNDLLS